MANIITKNLEKKEFRNTWLIAIITLFVVGFYYLLPDAKPKVMLVFLILTILSVTILANFKKISEFATYKPERPLHKKLIGFNENIVVGLIIGGVAGFGFVWLTSLNAFAILSLSIPSLPYSIDSASFVIKILAPIVETLFFTLMLSFLGLFFSFFVSAVLRSIFFSSYHFVTYVILGSGSFSSVTGAFIGAFLFGMVGSYLAVHFGSEADFSAHSVVNWTTFSREFGKLSVVG